jgi:hypothetical protein
MRRLLLTLIGVSMMMTALLAQSPADLSVCEGKGYTLYSKADAVAASGEVTYSWYEDGGLLDDENEASLTIAAGKALGVHEYVRMAAGEDCPDGVPSNTFTVTVNPLPAIHTANQTVNQGTPISTILYIASAGAVISRTGSLPPGITEAVNGSSYTISGTPSGTGTFGYALTSTTEEGCTSAVTAGTITVIPVPTISLSGANQIAGQNTLMTNIIYTASAGAVISRTGDLPPGVIGVTQGASYTISGRPSATGTFGYSLTSVVNGYSSTAASGTITVVPTTLCTQCCWNGTIWMDCYVTTHAYPFVTSAGAIGASWIGGGLNYVSIANSPRDGRANTYYIKNNGLTSTSGAVGICLSLGTGWYLPAYEELINMSAGTATSFPPLNGRSGANLLATPNAPYWSSTEYYNNGGRRSGSDHQDSAVAVDPSGLPFYNGKTDGDRIRCVWRL